MPMTHPLVTAAVQAVMLRQSTVPEAARRAGTTKQCIYNHLKKAGFTNALRAPRGRKPRPDVQRAAEAVMQQGMAIEEAACVHQVELRVLRSALSNRGFSLRRARAAADAHRAEIEHLALEAAADFLEGFPDSPGLQAAAVFAQVACRIRALKKTPTPAAAAAAGSTHPTEPALQAESTPCAST